MNTPDALRLRSLGVILDGEIKTEATDEIAELSRQILILAEDRDHWRAQATARFDYIEIDGNFRYSQDHVDTLHIRNYDLRRRYMRMLILTGLLGIAALVDVVWRLSK